MLPVRLLPRHVHAVRADDAGGGALPNCDGQPVELGQRGLRVGAIFVILAASLMGALAPVVLARQTRMRVPKVTFFVFKFIGTGVIIATAWMHLLAPAVDQLGDACVGDRWRSMKNYPWALCIGLMTVMVMFFVELVASRFEFAAGGHDSHAASDSEADAANGGGLVLKKPAAVAAVTGRRDVSYPPGGEDHLAHRHEHAEGDSHAALAGQLTAIFILDFGVVFHSVFIGLTLGTIDGEGLVALLVVLVFHQMFEGLGLGSRLAIAPWPRGRGWVPYALAIGFALSTPVGLAAGLGTRPDNAATQKLVNGIFDAISAGILMYTGLVELLAHEFMFNPHMRRASFRMQLFAFGCVAFGVAVMALLAKWA